MTTQTFDKTPIHKGMMVRHTDGKDYFIVGADFSERLYWLCGSLDINEDDYCFWARCENCQLIKM